ncbi:MAG: serine/threonine-protein phosphatase [Leptospiraceae bacterium]|nr:serine/threonine-protein phosphatase [Leptospiraceae bacterium]
MQDSLSASKFDYILFSHDKNTHFEIYKILLREYGNIINRELKKSPVALNSLMKEGNTYREFLNNQLDSIKSELGEFEFGNSFFEKIYNIHIGDGEFDNITAKNMLLMYRSRIENFKKFIHPEDDKELQIRLERLFEILSENPDSIRIFNLQEKYIREEIILSVLNSSGSEEFKKKAVYIIERQSLQLINFINELSIKYFTNTLQEELKLKKELTLRQKEVEEELKRARKIQLNLLPTSLPLNSTLRILSRYLPLTSVGGDFFDVQPIDYPGEKKAECIGLIIADVSGHGIPAAFIASMTKISWQNAIKVNPDPQEVLKKINEQLHGLTSGNFLTALTGIFLKEHDEGDNHCGKFIFSNAAHYPPFILRNDGTFEYPNLKGYLLGVFPEVKVLSKEVYFGRGDRFIFFTDGLVESRNIKSKELLGEQRLQTILSETRGMDGESSCDYIIDKIKKFSASEFLEDDLTLIVIDIV